VTIKSINLSGISQPIPQSAHLLSRDDRFIVFDRMITGKSIYDCIQALGESGEYLFNTLYAGRVLVEFILINESTTYSSNTNIGSSTNDERMLIVQYNGDLTVNSGVTLSASARKRGVVLHVKGNMNINGSINLTGIGAARTPGDRLLLVGSSELSANGATGGPGANGTVFDNAGCQGSTGSSGATGGGGGGGKGYGPTATANGGAGTAGTSYSGGSGGGGGGHGSAAEPAFSYSGPGGIGSHGGTIYGGGGAGHPGGIGGEDNAGYGGRKGQDGAGGVLIAFVEQSITGTGSIVSNGRNGANNGDSWSTGGGGSGGGGINLFYRSSYTFSGSINVTGGTRGNWAYRNYAGGESRPGGNGGTGSSRVQQF
jgi:hypothetical protein